MKRSLLSVLSIATALGFSVSVHAETLDEALALAYHNNPTLQAQRAGVTATDEGVAQALSNWRPSVSFSGDIGKRYFKSSSKSSGVSEAWLEPNNMTLSVSQPLYRGGRTGAQTTQAENNVLAARERLRSTEQTVMLQGATAYLNVLRDAAVVELNENNVRVLQRQLEATQDRFDVGEVTRTDVSQAEARLAGARSELISSQGTLETSKANYERVIGKGPERLRRPAPLSGIPATEEELVTIAVERSPGVLAAQYDELAASANVDLIEGELLPTVSLDASIDRSWESTSDKGRSQTATVQATLNVPIYQQGAVFSRVRQAKQTAGQRRIQVEEARRAAIETATSAWETFETAKASIISLEAQVEASTIALEGVEREAAVGSRTVLDVLDAEQELLQARVNLVSAQRNAAVAAYEVKSSMGALTAEVLGLDVQAYDPTENYNRVREQWWGTE